MRTALEWIMYIIKCLDAVSEGLKIVYDKWPADRHTIQPEKKE